MTVSEQIQALDEKFEIHSREAHAFWARTDTTAVERHVFHEQFALRSEDVHRRICGVLDQMLAESRLQD